MTIPPQRWIQDLEGGGRGGRMSSSGESRGKAPVIAVSGSDVPQKLMICKFYYMYSNVLWKKVKQYFVKLTLYNIYIFLSLPYGEYSW